MQAVAWKLLVSVGFSYTVHHLVLLCSVFLGLLLLKLEINVRQRQTGCYEMNAQHIYVITDL